MSRLWRYDSTVEANRQGRSLRKRIYEIIFEAETPAGKAFDVLLLVCIVASVLTVMLESVVGVQAQFGGTLRVLEWVFTALFTLEYVLRMVSVERPRRYAASFFGVVDLLSVLPSYLSLLLVGTHSLLVIRALRLLRVFRVLKLTELSQEAHSLNAALRASWPKISVFLGTLMIIALLMGSTMYLVEGPDNGFTSIPRGVYWAVVTLTTVGYGDLSPHTDFGQFLATCVMVMGYGIIAVPTGIVTVELAQAARKSALSTRTCRHCTLEGHDVDAVFCKQCGVRLET